MASTTFDTQAAVTGLRNSGLDEGPAIAIVNTLRDALSAGLDEGATKADLEATKADLESTVADLRADLYRALWIQGAGLVTIQIAIAGVVVALIKLL